MEQRHGTKTWTRKMVSKKSFISSFVFDLNLSNSKKAIGPVVAIALLLVVAVVAVVEFQTWFNSYQSDINSNVETKSSDAVSNSGIEGIFNNILYFKNSGNEIIYLNKIKVGDNCVYTGSIQPNTVGEIPLDNCTSNLKGTYKIVAISNKKIYYKTLYLGNVDVLTGSLVDSPVEGVKYNTSSGLNGITDSNGDFKYKSGDLITFTIGNTTFTSKGRNYITPLDIFGTTNLSDKRVVNLVRLFMSLDIDNDPCNGILLNSTKVSLINSNLDFNQDLDNFDSTVPSIINISKIYELDAITHLKSEINLLNGLDGSVCVSHTLGSCYINGFLIQNGSSYTFYDSPLPLNNLEGCSGSVLNQTRTCSNGVLSGDSNFSYICNASKAPSSTYGEWVLVPGNSVLGTNDFYVMKYEAKWNGIGTINDITNMYCGSGSNDETNGCPTDGSIGILSQANDKPLTQVNQDEARQLCLNLGSNYHLITNAQWITIARNIEVQPYNWADGVVGSLVSNGGGLKRGNVGITDSASYDGADPESGTGRNTKALLNLSNGQGIWDLSGNVWEWKNDTFTNNTASALGQSSSAWYEWDVISGYDYLESGNSTYNSSYGIGMVYADVDDAYPSGTTHGFLAGGHWLSGANAGAFALDLGDGPLSSPEFFGFRCAYEP